ncbi:hypothetical protein JCM9279_003340 [Rhodotorula babjevae]
MVSRSSSPASTVRHAGPPRPRSAAARPPGERDDFLASALARLNLSRPSTPSLARAHPALVDTTAPTHDDPSIWRTLSAATSACSATGDEDEEDEEGPHSLLEGRTAAQQYADSVVLLTLGTSTTGDGSEWAHEVDGGARKRLVFYQALLIQFERCKPEDVPSSVTACLKLLRRIHVCIPHYLAVVRRGGIVAEEVEQFKSVLALREYLQTGSKKQRAKKLIPRDVAKSEFLKPFLITVG